MATDSSTLAWEIPWTERNLVGYSPWGRKELDTTERVRAHTHTRTQYLCKAPNTIRDYVYVGDAAKAIERILESDYAGPINVSSGQPRAMREVFGFIADTLGKRDLLSFENEDACGLILAGDNRVFFNTRLSPPAG